MPFDLVVDFVPELLGTFIFYCIWRSKSPTEVEGFRADIGEGQAMRLAVGLASTAAMHDVPVLLLGETGTGKGMFARAIHNASPRRDKPFEAVSLAAIPRDLFESELFGHEKGKFTGAGVSGTSAPSSGQTGAPSFLTRLANALSRLSRNCSTHWSLPRTATCVG